MNGFLSESKSFNGPSKIYKNKCNRNRNIVKIKEKEYLNVKKNKKNNNLNSNMKYNTYLSSKDNTNFIYKFINFLFIIILLSINSKLVLSNINSIVLTITQTGNHRIFFNGHVDDDYYPNVTVRPDKVLINTKEKVVSEKYNFVEEENTIELIFDSLKDNIACLFYQCSSITEIDLSNFDTSSVTNMAHLFHGCSSLTSVNLNGLKTDILEHTDSMFQECPLLKSLDLSMFNTANVVFFHSMFYNCLSITSLDLSNFITNKAENMAYMFSGCINLNYLDISKFDTSTVLYMQGMFSGCSSLKSLNLSYFKTDKVKLMSNMFSGCSQLKTVNFLNAIINDNTSFESIIDNSLKCPIICIKDSSILTKIISQYECPLISYSDWRVEEINLINNKFIDNCVLSPNGEDSCYEICSYKIYYNEEINQYQCTENEQCPESHQKLIREKNICAKSCEESKEYKFEYNNICLQNCPSNFNELEQKPYYCFPSCPEEKPFILIESLDCVLNCSISERQNELCVSGYTPRNNSDYNVFNKILEQTKIELKNNFDNSVINGNPIYESNSKMIITKTNNENNNAEVDINFGQCESDIKDIYNIPKNESLYLLMIEVEQEGMNTPSIEYELYYPIDGPNYPNLVKLDIQLHCKNSKIKITKKVNLTQDIDEYNSSSKYYNDICFISESNNAYDICLKDKQNIYVKNNMSVCEINCDFISYNYETQKAVCSCDIKTEIPFMNDIKFDKKLLLKKFIDFNNIANIQMIFCYKNIFKIKRILKNYGCFIFVSFIAINIGLIFLFYFLDYKKLLNDINKIKIFVLNNKKKSKDKNKKNNILKTKTNIKRKGKIKFETNSNEKSIKTLIKLEKKTKKNNNQYNTTKEKNIFSINNKNKKSNKHRKKKILSHKIKNVHEINLNYSELNSLNYRKALVLDKRAYIQYYISLLKTNHNLLSILYSRDYNSRMMKISIFLFNLSSDITVNALFFNDSTMHKIYIDQGSYNIVYQLPQIIYSMLISTALNCLINLLGLSEDIILDFKKAKKHINKKYMRLIKILKIKFGLFFLANFLLLLLFGYYITCFCGIYKNTQFHLLKDSILSLISSLITPLFIYLIPGIFRIAALKKKKKLLYSFSKILQLL